MNPVRSLLEGKRVVLVDDHTLFRQPCKAAAIREAFNYYGYKGGKVIRWRPPSAKKLKAAEDADRRLFRAHLAPSSRAFWRNLHRASLEVASWPDWKRSIDLYAKTPKKDTPEDLKAMRDELLHWDALDYWQRQPCTEDERYRPAIVRGRVTEPTCNSGLGCSGCWARHEAFRDKLSENAPY
jgi:hypothetical protein